MINFDDVANESIKGYNPNWPQISDHSYKILIVGGCWSRKTNLLFNLKSHQADISKNYIHAKHP